MSGFTQIGVGTTANDGSGDALRAAMQAINDNYGSTVRALSTTSLLASEKAAIGYVRLVSDPVAGGIFTASTSGVVDNVSIFPSATVGFFWVRSSSNDAQKTYFYYAQNTPSTRWQITHGLMRHPSVTIINVDKDVVIGDVEHIDKNRLEVTFSTELTGTAYLV